MIAPRSKACAAPVRKVTERPEMTGVFGPSMADVLMKEVARVTPERYAVLLILSGHTGIGAMRRALTMHYEFQT